MLLSEAWSNYEVDRKLIGYSEHTLRGYKIQFNLLVKNLGDKEINQITLVELKEYLLKQAKHLMPSSLGHRIRFIRAFFRYLIDDGYIERNPAAKLREPKLGSRVPKAFNDEEVELLRDSCASLLEKALTELFYATGCRIGEVNRINKADIDWDRRSIMVIGKGNKQREVYFTTKCKVWLLKYLKSRTDDYEALFISQRKPIRRMSVDQLRYWVKKIAARSDVKVNVYPHRWRHSMATTMLNNGAPMEVIAANLGHARISTTMIYAQLSGERRRQEYNKYFR